MGLAAPSRGSEVFREVLETTIRIGLILLLLFWCFQIVRPFVIPILWGFIIAIAVAPLYLRLTTLLAGRRRLAAAVVVVLGLVLFIAPAVKLSDTLVGGLQNVAARFEGGSLSVPPPPAQIAEWPIIGARLSEFWGLAASNLEAALARLAPQISVAGKWLLSAAAGVGLGLLQFVFSTVIAGVVLAHGVESRTGVERLVTRLVGQNGPRFVALSESTIRSVAVGIVGVAIIQSTLVGIGFAVAGVPGAGLWALVSLFLCIIQLGPGLLLLPAVVYVFSIAATSTAVVFLVWCIFVGLIDNVLKPLLLGRGVDAPIVIIFIGSIGGFLSMGIVGLFVGAVVLVLFYTLAKSWLNEEVLDDAGRPNASSGVGAVEN